MSYSFQGYLKAAQSSGLEEAIYTMLIQCLRNHDGDEDGQRDDQTTRLADLEASIGKSPYRVEQDCQCVLKI